MDVDFEEMKVIYEALNNASDLYDVKEFKPWTSEVGKEYITIKMKKKAKFE